MRYTVVNLWVVLLLYAIALPGTGCRSKHLSHKRQPKEENVQVIPPAVLPPQILFLTFSASQDTVLQTLDIRLKDKKTVEGKLKPDLHTTGQFSSSLKLLFSNAGGSALKELYVDHPLHRRVDVYEGSAISSRELNLLQADFMVRVEWIQGMTTVTISEFIHGKATKNSLTLKLN